MGIKFRKSIKVMPGVRINLSNRGVSSVSVGRRGAKVNFGRQGVRSTVGLSGTGLSYTNYTPYRQAQGVPVQQLDYRPVSLWLGIGIFLLPIIFAWFTLRSGHTLKSRIISFLWLITFCVGLV